jgi:hypothetical protein
MVKEGWTLAYQIPVAGFPWAIPFEFPSSQTLAAAIVAVSSFELEAAAGFVSSLFLVACAKPAFCHLQATETTSNCTCGCSCEVLLKQSEMVSNSN